MRKLVLALLVLCAAPTVARAEIGLGVFLGQPTGFDIKIDLQRRSALDIVLGVTGFHTYRDDRYDRFRRDSYGHITYLLTPVVGRGRSVLVPLRIGIGMAAYGVFENDFNLAARVPFEVALLFRRTPLEIYGEITLKLVVLDEHGDDAFVDGDGGIGMRFYF